MRGLQLGWSNIQVKSLLLLAWPLNYIIMMAACSWLASGSRPLIKLGPAAAACVVLVMSSCLWTLITVRPDILGVRTARLLPAARTTEHYMLKVRLPAGLAAGGRRRQAQTAAAAVDEDSRNTSKANYMNLPAARSDLVTPVTANYCSLSVLPFGHWRQRENVTAEQRNESFNYYWKYMHEQFKVPPGRQRVDGRCGDPHTYGNNILKALCNPDGGTPCCAHGECISSDVRSCERVAGSLDMRRDAVPEISQFVLDQSGQKPHHCGYESPLTNVSFCAALGNRTLKIKIFGDSLMRQIYSAMLIVLSGDFQWGAMGGNRSHVKCKGANQFYERTCRFHLKTNTVFCSGHVQVFFMSCFKADRFVTAFCKNHVLSEVGKIGSYLAVGIGWHDNCNSSAVIKNYLARMLQIITSSKNSRWPNLLWVTPHTEGQLKKGEYSSGQSTKRCRPFNLAIRNYLTQFQVPVFDTEALTRKAMSQDGSHFGPAVNLQKAKIMLRYILEDLDHAETHL